MFGWRGRLLRVNLTSGVIKKESLEPSVARDYLGGRGLGLYLHTKEVSGSAVPLGDENHLIFATGPLTGTLAPNGGRCTIVTRTPPAGALSAASISSKWGSELKFAGFDAVIFEGAASKPVYLWINNGKAELRSAAQTAGKNITETTEILLEETDPRAAVSCIGPGGENKVACSVIVTEGFSAAGRSGAGAVMGSKNLKAIVVCGTDGFRMANFPAFLNSAAELRSFLRTKAIAAKGTCEQDSMLMADSLVWEPIPTGLKAARTRGCFGCATSFSSFESPAAGRFLPIPASTPPAEMGERLKEYRFFVDLGLDFSAALKISGRESGANREELARKLASGADPGVLRNASPAACMERGPCMAAGYMVFPRMTDAENSALGDLMALLDSAGLCPFLCGAVGMEQIAELLKLATGVSFSQQDISQVAQRVREFTR